MLNAPPHLVTQGTEWEQEKLRVWAEVKQLQKAVTAFRSVVRSQERVVAPRKGKRTHCGEVVNAEQASSNGLGDILAFLQKTYLAQHGNRNCGGAWKDFPKKSVKVGIAKERADISGMSCVRALTKWTATEIKDRTSISAAISGAAHWSKIKNMISSGAKIDQKDIFAAPFSGAAWMQEVFALSLVRYKTGTHPWALPVFCLSAGALVLEGSATIVCAKVDALPGDTLKSKLDQLNDMTVESLTGMLSAAASQHQCFSVGPGDMFVLPAGFMAASLSKDLVLLRWPRLQRGKPELRKVMLNMALATQAFPKQCVGHFADLSQYVESEISAIEEDSS